MRKDMRMVLAGVLIFITSMGAGASVVFDNLSAGTSSTVIGYFGSGYSAGGEVSLGGTGTIDSFTWSNYDLGPYDAVSDLRISFFSVDPSTDSAVGTSDDKIGSLLGSYTAEDYAITPYENNTISGFSIDVPETFIWTIWNEDHSFAMRTTTSSTATVGSFLKGYFFSGIDLTTGAGLLRTTNTAKVQFTGSAVPEPASAMMLLFGAGVGMIIRRVLCAA